MEIIEFDQLDDLRDGARVMMEWNIAGNNQEDVTFYKAQLMKKSSKFVMLTVKEWRFGREEPPYTAALPTLSGNSYNDEGELHWDYDLPVLPSPDLATYTLIQPSLKTPERPPKRKREYKIKL